jgi:hypothetical protein
MPRFWGSEVTLNWHRFVLSGKFHYCRRWNFESAVKALVALWYISSVQWQALLNAIVKRRFSQKAGNSLTSLTTASFSSRTSSLVYSSSLQHNLFMNRAVCCKLPNSPEFLFLLQVSASLSALLLSVYHWRQSSLLLHNVSSAISVICLVLVIRFVWWQHCSPLFWNHPLRIPLGLPAILTEDFHGLSQLLHVNPYLLTSHDTRFIFILYNVKSWNIVVKYCNVKTVWFVWSLIILRILEFLLRRKCKCQ